MEPAHQDHHNRRQHTHRIIKVNSFHQNEKFCNNKVSTCKYNVLTFLPRFLLEQFRRYNNVFFLVIALLQQIPDVSPTGRYTTAGPFVIILFISALKEVFEDLKRRRMDIKVNNFTTHVLRNGAWQVIQWQDITVGEIIKLQNNDLIPADLIIISSSEPNSMAYIETSNLDGETNLKIRQGLVETAGAVTIEKLSSFKADIECEAPSKHVNSFSGAISLPYDNTMRPLSVNQLLLRGAAVKNTKWVTGVAIYTGHDAKSLMNSRTAPLKRSYIDTMTNNRIIVLFGILVLLAGISTIGALIYHSKLENAWYLGTNRSNPFYWDFITFFILYNNLIPISLQVTLEMVRFFQASYINQDIEMYHEESDTTAVARTSNLNEELGQIKYIMSDKTGTLTRNEMRFKKLFVCNKNYGNDYAEEFDDKAVIDDLLMNIAGSEMIRETFRVMGICHTVVPEQNENGNINDITYQAASPDELALVKGAKSMDFIFTKRFPDAVILRALGTDERIQILNVLEFTSSRKRMSVVTRDGNGTIKLYTKGADAVILPRLSKNISEREHEMLNNQLNDYANHGYRTLCFAMKIIDEETYDNWKGRFVKASIALQSREEGLEQIAEELENDLTFVGASAIEDKLQIGVPETISSLLEAKIKIWILTGDKRETAINIAQSSALFKPDSKILILHGKTFDETFHCLKDIQRKSDTLKNNNQKFALVVDGTCLQSAITGECRTPFLDLSLECETVVCCRMSPMQKAEVVELVQSRCNHVMSVGDGANDVAMIQSANVGVGISGAEGLQAASASDYSIAQFRFLKRLILVHGAWNYNRSVKVILYSFYKNICLYLIELWFALYSAFSGQTLFERWTIASFNVIFTALPPIILGLFDRPVSEEQLINNPYLYKSLQKVSFSNAQFYYWIFMSVVHSIVLFWMSYGFLYNPVVWSTGNSGGWLMLGNSCYTFVIVTVCMKALIECDSWTVVIAAFSIGSIGLWFVFFFLYSIAWPILPIGADMAGHFWIMVSSPTFWFALILIPTTTLLPDVIVKCINLTMYPTMCDAAKLREKAMKRSIALTPSQLENSSSASYRPTTDRVSLNCQGVTRKCKVANNTEVTSLRPNPPDITHNYGTTCTIVPTPDGAYVNYACQDDQHNTYSRSETSQLVSVVHIPDTSV